MSFFTEPNRDALTGSIQQAAVYTPKIMGIPALDFYVICALFAAIVLGIISSRVTLITSRKGTSSSLLNMAANIVVVCLIIFGLFKTGFFITVAIFVIGTIISVVTVNHRTLHFFRSFQWLIDIASVGLALFYCIKV
jgi:hypothetical protein